MSEPNLLSNDPAEDIAPVSPFGVIDYGITAEELQALAEQYSDITEINGRRDFEKARSALTSLVRARNDIETRRKELKAESLQFGKLVDSTARELQAVTEDEEARLKKLVDADNKRREDEKAERERLERERINAIQEAMNVYRLMPVQVNGAGSEVVLAARDKVEAWEITEAEMQEFVEEAAELKASVIEELNELYAGALHDERIAEEERKRQEAEDAARAEEDARLKAEREELEAQQRAIEEENQRIAAEQAERQAKIDAENERQTRRLREEQEALAAERQAIEDAKREEAERQERERIAKEQAEAAEKAEKERQERAERLKPDKEKLHQFAQELDRLPFPELTNNEGEAALAELDRIVTAAVEQIDDLAEGL